MTEYNLCVSKPSLIDYGHSPFPSPAIGTIRFFTLVYTPSSTTISCISNTEVDSFASQNCFSVQRQYIYAEYITKQSPSYRPLFPRHLPATLLASFVKRLSRLSLTAPPSSIVITIPFVYNILKRHPALMCMIHRDGEVPEPYEGEPPFPRIHNVCHSIIAQIPFCPMSLTQT